MADNGFDAVLVGGPRDGVLLQSEGATVAEVEIDGLLHRYHITTKRREHDGAPLTVYVYDGVIDPSGAQPGVETPETGAHAPVAQDRLSQ
jgi:hypothetical protein